MTTPTEHGKPEKPDKGRQWAITVLAGLLVAFSMNYLTHSPVGYFFGVIAGALAWHIFKPRQST